MISIIGEFIDGITSFFESCACHPKPKNKDARQTSFRHAWSENARIFKSACGHHDAATYAGWTYCPFSGRLCPQLAAGKLWEFVEEIASSCWTHVLRVCCELSPIDRDKVIKDWDAAKKHIYFILTMKFGCWDTFPYKMFAIALPNDAEAIEQGILCKRLWENLTDEDKAIQHVQIRKFFDGSTLAQEFEQWITQGTRRRLLPSLWRIVCKFALTISADQSSAAVWLATAEATQATHATQ